MKKEVVRSRSTRLEEFEKEARRTSSHFLAKNPSSWSFERRWIASDGSCRGGEEVGFVENVEEREVGRGDDLSGSEFLDEELLDRSLQAIGKGKVQRLTGVKTKEGDEDEERTTW